MTGSSSIIERRACISGIGQSDIGRRLHRDPLELTLDAALAAVADAGLTVGDIDGVSTYPGAMPSIPGFSGAGAYDVIDALRLDVGWYDSGAETPGQLGSVMKACLAVAAGLANHVLCFRSVYEGSARASGAPASFGGIDPARSKRVKGFMEWRLPFAAPSPANWVALLAQRHFHLYGTTREQLAWVALNGRRNAMLNPKAVYRDPLTLDDYLSARLVSTPFGLYDCDVPCDGATAVIVSRVERATDLRHPLVRVEAIGAAMRGRPSWDQFDDLSAMASRDAAAQLWSRTDLRPSDVQLAELYDGFSFLTLSWLEALGFCGVGESGPFVEGGDRIARDGTLPLNTHGGQLSEGRLHGYGFLHEAVLQMRGDAGARQVPRVPEVAAVAAGGSYTCGCLLLVRD